MSWARLDDRFWSNPKVRRAWRRSRGALGLYALALSYCAQHETDGLVDSDWVKDVLPVHQERSRLLGVLLEAGLFERTEQDFRVHDYLDFNFSREETNARSAELSAIRSAAGKKGAAARWQADGKRMASANGNPKQTVDGRNASHPIPIETPTTTNVVPQRGDGE